MMSKSLLAQLASSKLFQALDLSILHDLEPELERLHLKAGEVLFRQGDDGDALYVLLRGRLGVRIQNPDGSEANVDDLTPGATVGEMALLTGQKRVATVSALADAELARLSRAAFERLVERDPKLGERLIEIIRPRFQRTQLTEVLTDWFGPLDTAALHAIQNEIEWIHLTAGEVLFRQGDSGDAMYLVVSGRLRIVNTAGGGEGTLGEVGRGESVGEIAILTKEPRSATVVAVRDTNLVKLPWALVERYPQLAIKIAQHILQRNRHRLHLAPRHSTAATFAVLPLGDEVPLSGFTWRLAERLGSQEATLHLSSQTFDRAFGKEGAAQARPEQLLDLAVMGWLNEREREYRRVVYEADPAWTPWTQRCLRQADRILLLARAGADPRLSELERALQETGSKTPRDLVLLQPDSLKPPSGTLAWLTPRSLSAYHHLRMTSNADLARLARRLTNRAVGLVLSGGGARGYAHIGLLRACEESGLPCDFIGGASMGALVGGAYALSQDYRFCYEQAVAFGNPKLLLDYTFPFAALTASRRITSIFQAMFAEVQVEDLWTPFFCVSANLTRAELVVHERGPLWRAIRASTAIPGVFTPILHQGDVLTDGGAMNNFPVDIMRDKLEGGIVIGSSADLGQERGKRYDFGDALSGWRLLLSRFAPFGEKPRVPSIIDTLVHATVINRTYLINTMSKMADLTIDYPTESYDMLQFDRYEELVDLGYREAKRAIEAWLQTGNILYQEEAMTAAATPSFSPRAGQ